jgi:TolA-binding protein
MTVLKRNLFVLSCLALSLAQKKADAQEHLPFQYSHQHIMRADEQLRQEFYVLAAQSAGRHLAQQQLSGIPYYWQDERMRARYIRAMGYLKTSQAQAADSAIRLLEQSTNPAFRARLSLALAQHYFLKGSLAGAIPYYEQAGIDNLTNEEIADAKFELAYCYFNTQQLDKAEPLFAIMKEVPGKYYSAGNYYYGLLAYNRGAYADALKSFDRIDEEPRYRPFVPYYMAEIEYYLGNRQKALQAALNMMKQPEKVYYDNELHLLAAQTLFEEQRYGDALPYFEYYYNNTSKIRKEELYEMAYSYYRVNEWKNAIDKFKPLSNTQDSLGQTAMYLLGDSYLKAGDKRSARNAFGLASAMRYNAGQREAALLLHAKLSYELGYSDDALRSVNTLISEYGGSKDAFLLQSQLFAATSNYKDAYEALLQARGDDEQYRQTMQRVAYGYALQQLQKEQTDAADSLLTASLENGRNPAYKAAANFWKGDIAYRRHNNSDALAYSKIFIESYPGSNVQSVSTEATPAHAYLNMGYASLDAGDYAGAQQYFSKAGTTGSREVAANAGLREADALFMQKDFNRAGTLYAKAAGGSGRDAEYARLQQAVIYGLQGKTADKIRILQGLMNTSSPYATDARYELGVAEMERNHYDEAVTILSPLTTSKNGSLAAKSLLKTGTAYQQLNQDEQAIAAYRRIISNYSNAPERSDALAALKSLYIEQNKLDAYTALLKEANLPDDIELDAAYYSAAEAQYASGNWNAAQLTFSRYLQQYPTGAFANKAHYYSAESFYQQKKYSEALAEYDAVLQNEWNDFSEESAVRSGAIATNAGDYTAAARYYGQLRNKSLSAANLQLAYTGLMRSADKINNSADAARYADTLLALPDLPPAVIDEARLLQARQLTASGRSASTIYQSLTTSKNTAIAAEARYYTAADLLRVGKLKEAEDAAGKNIRLSAGNDYWVVKTYILLGDILAQEKDYFNAKATLQSVIQNSKSEELKAEAQRKLDGIKQAEGSKLSND